MHILKGRGNYLLDNQKVCAGMCLLWALRCHLALPVTSPMPNPWVIPAHPTEPSSSSKRFIKVQWMAPGTSEGTWVSQAASLCTWGADFSEPSRDVGCHLCQWLCWPGSGAALASGGWGWVRFCALKERVTPWTRGGQNKGIGVLFGYVRAVLSSVVFLYFLMVKHHGLKRQWSVASWFYLSCSTERQSLIGSVIARGAALICSLPLPWETQERGSPDLQEDQLRAAMGREIFRGWITVLAFQLYKGVCHGDIFMLF